MTKDLRLLGLEQNSLLAGPESVHIDITNSCNTNCVTCWDHSPWLQQARAAAWKRQRLDLPSFTRLLDDILSLGGLKAVILSGMGEPFTHPSIYQMIEHVKAAGLHLTIITNLVAADVDRIIELGVDQLLIGVQGASQKSYEAFHPNFQSGHAWPVLLQKLQQAKDAGRRFKHVQVICSHNHHELSQMVEMAHHYGALQVNFKLASLKHGTEQVALTPEQRLHLRDHDVPAAQDRARQLGVTTNLDVFAQQLGAGGHSTAPIREVGCYMGHYYARVLVDGSVLYCCNVEVQVGQIRDASFADLWRGPDWAALRQRLRQGDYFPGCHQCGKLNQNVKIGQRFAKAFGEERRRAITGL